MMDSQSFGTIQSPSTFSESSMSGRSLGNIKSFLAVERDTDLSQDNPASPIDLECHIQSERISKILHEAIHKCKLVLTLPGLAQDRRYLRSVLSAQDLDDLIFIFEQYDNPLFSASLLNMGAMEDIKAGDLSFKNRVNPELGHVIYIMNSYPALNPKVEEMVKQMKVKYMSSSTTAKKPAPALEYLLTIERFHDLMITQIKTSAAEELAAKIKTRKLQASNEKLLENIKEYTIKLNEDTESFEQTMECKRNIINKLEKELSVLKFEASCKLKKKILDSERQMVLASRAHAIKSEMLKEEEEESREVYDELLKHHVIEEKNLRARRFKVETQLLSWLQKYDSDMGDKQLELDEFVEKYEDELHKFEDLEKQIAEQDLKYLPLMEEREKEYHQEMTRKMEDFMLDHAAKVIQHAWRTVMGNRAEKKRLRKLQKKMQQEAAEAAAAEREKEKQEEKEKGHKK